MPFCCNVTMMDNKSINGVLAILPAVGLCRRQKNENWMTVRAPSAFLPIGGFFSSEVKLFASTAYRRQTIIVGIASQSNRKKKVSRETNLLSISTNRKFSLL